MQLLLMPQRLRTDYIVLESYHQDQKSFFSSPLNNTEIRRFFFNLPKAGRDLLAGLSKEKLQPEKEQIRLSAKLRNGSGSAEDFFDHSMRRLVHGRLNQLKQFSPKFKWYHKIELEKGRFITKACTFSNVRPQLSFEVILQNKQYAVDTIFTIDGKKLTPQEYNLYYFLLESGNIYYLLNFQDYDTLQWLDKNQPQFTNDADAFLNNIVTRLENNYVVNRNGHFEVQSVHIKPAPRLLVQEISGSFLMLTPQFVYDGYVQEHPFTQSFEVSEDGKLVSIARNKDDEFSFYSFIESLHPNFKKQFNGNFHLSFAEAHRAQWFHHAYHQLLDNNVELVGIDMLRHFRYSPHTISTKFSVLEEHRDHILYGCEISFGKEKIPLATFQKALLAGQRAILLEDESLGLITEEWLNNYSVFLLHGKVQNNTLLVSRWVVFQQEESSAANTIPALQQTDWWARWKQWVQGDDPVFEIPTSLNTVELRPYQQKGYDWLRLLSEAGAGACLADDMGLGKTIQTICFLIHRLERDPNARILVIAPTSLIYNWQSEFEKFNIKTKTLLFHGQHRSRAELENAANRIVLSSYGTVRNDIELFSRIIFDTIVVDESHNIKNPAAQITQAMQQLQSSFRIALSGTPVMNNTFDLYSQLNFLLPGLCGSREFFKKQYSDPIDRNQDEEKKRSLRRLISPFILRRTKEEVASDLPEKTETILWCSMKPDQQFAYETIKEKIKGDVLREVKENGLAKGKFNILQGLTKLRQLCNSAELVKDEDLFSSESIKTEMLIEELSAITKNHKALVFSQFTSMLDLLARDLGNKSFSFLRLDGSTPASERQELVSRFNDENSPERIFLISLKAGNAGLNLTSADYVFLFDPWWNTAVESQAIDRTHRIGQTKKVFAYKLICKNTVEERIVTLQRRKSVLSKELVTGEEGLLNQLTEDDLAFLFT